MKIATIIVSFGGNQNLQETLSSLKASSLDKLTHKAIVINNKLDNIGFAGGNNKGIKEALDWGADAVMLLNDDTKLDKEAVLNLSQSLFSNESVGMVVPKIYFYPGFEYHKSRYQKKDLGNIIWYAGGSIDWNNVVGVHRGVDEIDIGQCDRQENVEFATGCCLMIRREVFERIGLLNEKYFLYLEDLDFNVRVKKAGFKIIYQPQAVIWHKNAQSSGVGSGLHDYFFTRNRLLFGFSHASVRTKLALFRESIRLIITGSKWQKQGVVDFYLHRFGQGSWP